MENKKYKILYVALYCYSGHVKSQIDHLIKKNPLVDISILTDIAPDKAKSIYDNESFKIIWYNVKPVNKIKIKWLKQLLIRYKQNRYFSKFSKSNQYDIVNLQFPRWHISYAYKYLRRMSKKLVITPWGSDVLRIKYTKALEQLGKLYRKVDYIATSPDIPLGKKIIDEFKVAPDKFVGNFFGTEVVDFAIKHGDLISQDDAKKYFGLNGRYVITCGYNRRIAQRHQKIIAAIVQVKDRLPVNLTLLFPMTYGNTLDEEINAAECKSECEKRGLNAVFMTDFLSVEDLYKLRKATDMFIHIQTTDACSGSVQEYILCDKKIVHGSWMKYKELEAFKPLFYYPVDKLEDLGEVIANAYEAKKIDIPQGVFDYVKKSGWDHKATLMNEFFMSIV